MRLEFGTLTLLQSLLSEATRLLSEADGPLRDEKVARAESKVTAALGIVRRQRVDLTVVKVPRLKLVP